MLITIEEKPRRNRGLCLQSETSQDRSLERFANFVLKLYILKRLINVWRTAELYEPL